MAAQPEIEAYANHVKERFDLGKDINFDTKVNSCLWDEAAKTWTVKAQNGASYSCRFLVTCVGCLSEPQKLQIEGIDSFKGEMYYTSKFPNGGVDFRSKRVGVIGTGSS